MEVISIQGDFSFVVFRASVKLLNGNLKKKANGALEQHWTKTQFAINSIYEMVLIRHSLKESLNFPVRDSDESCSACAFYERARIISSITMYIYN